MVDLVYMNKYKIYSIYCPIPLRVSKLDMFVGLLHCKCHFSLLLGGCQDTGHTINWDCCAGTHQCINSVLFNFSFISVPVCLVAHWENE